MKLINLKTFWESNNLRFDSFKKGLAWTKRHMNSPSIRRISDENYLIDPVSAAKLYKEYLVKQEEIYVKRVQRAKDMTKLRKDIKKDV